MLCVDLAIADAVGGFDGGVDTVGSWTPASRHCAPPASSRLPDRRQIRCRRVHHCFTRYGYAVLRCSSMSNARPTAGKARCGQFS